MTGPRRRPKEAAVLRIGSGEALVKFRADFVGGLGDARADASPDSLGAGAEPSHRRDGRLHDSGQRTAPAAMRRADDACLRVGEQDRRAIGREYAERNARNGGNHRVGAGVFLAPPGALDGNRGRAVDLMATDETIGPEPEPGGCYRPVLLDAVRRVARAEAAIQRREHTAADPAMAGEEGVT